MNDKKIDKVCPKCGRGGIGADATVRWSVEDQEWYIDTVWDTKWCSHCEAEFKDAVDKEIQ